MVPEITNAEEKEGMKGEGKKRQGERKETGKRKKKSRWGIYCSDSLPVAPLRAGRGGSSERTTSRSDGEPITRSWLLSLVL